MKVGNQYIFSKEDVRLKIKDLTEDFGEKVEYIKTSGNYKEAQIEDEFIKPLFRYLNWNISNEGDWESFGTEVYCAGKQAKIDYKLEELRKVGGVYYTPDYIFISYNLSEK